MCTIHNLTSCIKSHNQVTHIPNAQQSCDTNHTTHVTPHEFTHSHMSHTWHKSHTHTHAHTVTCHNNHLVKVTPHTSQTSHTVE